MILEIDQGNTRAKWRILDGDTVRARGGFTSAELHEGELPAEWSGLPLRRARAANVAGDMAGTALQARLREQLGLALEFAHVREHCAGVTCGYREPAHLGVDRWLAVLAAHERDPRAALIVDCGSAVTLDLLDNGGRHLGGYILPGLDLMRRALYQDTDAVKVPEARWAPGMSLAPGADTSEAVERGLPLMVLGAVEESLAQLRAGGEEPLLWLAGGDGPLLSSLCRRPHQLVPELVLDGLALSNP